MHQSSGNTSILKPNVRDFAQEADIPKEGKGCERARIVIIPKARSVAQEVDATGQQGLRARGTHTNNNYTDHPHNGKSLITRQVFGPRLAYLDQIPLKVMEFIAE